MTTAQITFKLHETLYPKLNNTLKEVLEKIEMPLVPILADIERHGVLIDTQQLEAHGIALNARIHTLTEEAYTLAGQTFNLNSPKQLQDILYDTLKLPILSKTPKGQPSTAESVLQTLARDYPLPAVILQYRSLAKLVSTYIEALPKCIHPSTGRVHTSYNQAVTPAILICKIFPSAIQKDDAFDKPLSPPHTAYCLHQIIHKLNCALWRIYQEMLD